MKNSIIILLFFSFGILYQAQAQDRFRRDYSYVVINSPDKYENELFDGENVFVFNYNDNADVLHIRANGIKVVYIRTSPIEMDKDKDGDEYAIFKALNEHGEEIIMKIFTNDDYGVHILLKFKDDSEYSSFSYINK